MKWLKVDECGKDDGRNSELKELKWEDKVKKRVKLMNGRRLKKKDNVEMED